MMDHQYDCVSRGSCNSSTAPLRPLLTKGFVPVLRSGLGWEVAASVFAGPAGSETLSELRLVVIEERPFLVAKQ